MSESKEELRLDLCLFNLRFCKTREQAQSLIEKGRVRVNGQRVSRSSRKVRAGDVLVFPAHRQIFSIEVLGLPGKRVGAAIAQMQYKNSQSEAPQD